MWSEEQMTRPQLAGDKWGSKWWEVDDVKSSIRSCTLKETLFFLPGKWALPCPEHSVLSHRFHPLKSSPRFLESLLTVHRISIVYTLKRGVLLENPWHYRERLRVSRRLWAGSFFTLLLVSQSTYQLLTSSLTSRLEVLVLLPVYFLVLLFSLTSSPTLVLHLGPTC